MIGSNEVNKVIRKILSPELRRIGFQKVNTRHNYFYKDSVIWVIDITAIGAYSSSISDWPPASVFVEIGVYIKDCPLFHETKIKMSKAGEVLPKYYQCTLTKTLETSLNQCRYTENVRNPKGRERKDWWWIHPDGSNIEEVITDIASVFLNEGLPWLEQRSNLNEVLNELQKTREWRGKYHYCMHIAEKLGDKDAFLLYKGLYEEYK
ncbi:MAG: DUF4304 domain-containing protein [Bacilli bacterium]